MGKFLSLGIWLLLLSGCISSQFSNLQFGVDIDEYHDVDSFKTRVLLLGLFGAPASPSLFNISASVSDELTKEAIQSEIEAARGTAVRNIKLVHKATFGNILIYWLTIGIIAPSVVEISGTVIAKGKAKKANVVSADENIIEQEAIEE